MKILQVVDCFSPAYGGSAEVPYQLSRELAKRGHQIVIYASDTNVRRDMHIPGITLRAFKTRLALANFYVTPGIIKEAGQEIKNVDIIHMHNYRTFQNAAVHYYAQKYKIPYVVQAHGSLPRIVSKMRRKQLYDNVWGYRILKHASRVIAVAGVEVEQYKSMGVSEHKIEVVPNGIDTAEFDNLPGRGEFRRRYGLGDGQRMVLFLGRLDETKGLDLLIAAFAGLSQALSDVKLVIAGPDSGYLAALKRLIREAGIEEKVLLTGPLYGREKLAAYVDAEVFVLPSSYEIFGITILEALACGTPVVVTDRCGIAGVIGGQAGLAVPYAEGPLRDALRHMLSDDRMRHEFGGKGRLLVRERFSWEKIGERVEGVYKEILNA